MKKPAIIFTIADDKNLPLAKNLENSLKKFHPTIPFKVVTGMELNGYLKNDPDFFYRATPIIAEPLAKEYDLVLKIDADSIITGDLDYILNTKDYDVGTVINWNRVDPQKYGLIAGWGIFPPEYFNCGFVAMRSEKFIHHWNTVCHTEQFHRLQYREQDLLNILCYYGNYNVRCFDHGDGIAKYFAYHGLIAKGEWIKAKMVGEKIIIPKGEGDTPFPPNNMELKVIHFGGGKDKNTNFRTMFQEDVIKRLNYLISEKKVEKSSKSQ